MSIAYAWSSYKSTCATCLKEIKRRDGIGIPVDDADAFGSASSRARWAHARCADAWQRERQSQMVERNRSGYAIHTDTSLPTDPTPKKGGFDVAAGGFTNVYTATYSVPFDLAKPFELPIEPSVTLDPGVYLVAWYMQFPEAPVFNVRFNAEVSGKSGGSWRGDEWIPSICNYAPIPDSSPQGSTGYIADQWAPPYGAAPTGQFPGTIGYLTWFRAGTDKAPTDITGCSRPDFGGYDKKGRPIDKKGKPLKNPYDFKYFSWELGDLDMQLKGINVSPGNN